MIQRTLPNNTVNAVETNKGVGLVEADGRNNMNNGENPCRNVPADPPNCGNRGDAGDPFPGSEGRTNFDSGTTPASEGRVAVCDIKPGTATFTATFLVMGTRCSGAAPKPNAELRNFRAPATAALVLLPVAGLIASEQRRRQARRIARRGTTS